MPSNARQRAWSSRCAYRMPAGSLLQAAKAVLDRRLLDAFHADTRDTTQIRPTGPFALNSGPPGSVGQCVGTLSHEQVESIINQSSISVLRHLHLNKTFHVLPCLLTQHCQSMGKPTTLYFSKEPLIQAVEIDIIKSPAPLRSVFNPERS